GGRRGRRGVVHAAAGPAPVGAADAVRAGGRRGPAAVRAHRRPAADAGRDRAGLRGHPGADPADRVEDDVQAPSPIAVPGAAGLPRLTSTDLVRPHPAGGPSPSGAGPLGCSGGSRRGGGRFTASAERLVSCSRAAERGTTPERT